MKAWGTGHTDIGMQRSRNEDCMLVDNELGLYAVADGMGGHNAGDVASSIAILRVAWYIRQRRHLLRRIRKGEVDESLLPGIAAAAVAEACRAVYEKSVSIPELAGMGCTLTVLLVGKREAGMAHVGDSRLYLDRGGRVVQLTSDHTVAQELIRFGIVTPEDIEDMSLHHALSRAIGVSRSVEIEERLIFLQPGDRLVLCSDGLSDYIEKPARLATLLDDTEGDDSAMHLVEFANESGGHDNITAVVVEIEETSPLRWCRSDPALAIPRSDPAMMIPLSAPSLEIPDSSPTLEIPRQPPQLFCISNSSPSIRIPEATGAQPDSGPHLELITGSEPTIPVPRIDETAE